MALADFIEEISTHEFAWLLHFRITKPALVTNAKAISVLESEPMMNRTLTPQELGWLGDIISGLNANDFSDRDLEAATGLRSKGAITQAEMLVLLPGL